MKVFISSLIAGFEPFREAVRSAVTTLRHEPVMAEDFGARPSSPQVACLSGLREADAVVLVLGDRYGAVQASGLSATHEEYREAQGRKPVIARAAPRYQLGAKDAGLIRNRAPCPSGWWAWSSPRPRSRGRFRRRPAARRRSAPNRGDLGECDPHS